MNNKDNIKEFIELLNELQLQESKIIIDNEVKKQFEIMLNPPLEIIFEKI